MGVDIPERLRSQMRFLDELERLKMVYRRNKIVNRSRSESSAEHSWHVAMMAWVLLEHADQSRLDILKVVKMLLIHDIVEIVAGDTWAYDTENGISQREREEEAAQKLFSLLPVDQAEEFSSLRREFERRGTPEGAFAASIDALQPLTNHLLSGRRGDETPPLSRDRVLERKRCIGECSERLWQLAKEIVDSSVKEGLYT